MVTPNPCGVGQYLLCNFWTTPPPGANRAHTGYTVVVTAPNGTTFTESGNSFVADGTGWFQIVPDAVGNWTFQFTYGGDYYPAGTYINGIVNGTTTPVGFNAGPSTYPESEYAQPASAPLVTVTVTQQYVQEWPNFSPPSYWTTPINLVNRNWYSIAGSWPYAYPDTSTVNYGGPFVTGPTSSHIAWDRQGAVGGLIGGEAGTWSTATGGGTPSLIFEGRAYQTWTEPGLPVSVAACYSIQTGQVFYQIPIGGPTDGAGVTPTQISYQPTVGETVGSEGGISPVLIAISGGFLYNINPFSGAITFNTSIAPLTTGSFYNDMFELSIQTIGTGANTQYRLINWTVQGTSTVFASRIMNNISFPFATIGTADFQNAVGITQGRFEYGNIIGGVIYAVSYINGQVLWNWTGGTSASSSDSGGILTPYNPSSCGIDDGIYACSMENRIWMGWNDLTGKIVWVTPDCGYPLGDLWAYSSCSDGQQLYAFGYEGVFAFNWTNGAIDWIFKDTSVPAETPYAGLVSFNGAGKDINGILYTYNTEHTPTQPITRDWDMWAINTTNGQAIWNVTGQIVPGAVSDGYVTGSDSNDGYMYVFGPGPSATTVSVPQTAITSGAPVIISGTVLDQSPAQPGTACVSDASMTTWMDYLHMQQPIGGLWVNATVTGVPVSINAVDPSGTLVNIGSATSTMSGTYSFTWTPTTAGTWHISATFAGDDSYGSSSAQCASVVVNAPATATPAPATASPLAQAATTTELMTSTLAVGIAIIIAIAIATIVLLRKR